VRPRPSAVLALAGALAAALTLNGCSNNAQQNGSIAGAATGAAATASAQPSVSLYPVSGLQMSFDLPSDLNLEFQTTALSSATANEIETVLVDQYKAYAEALSSSSAKQGNYKELTVGTARQTENAELAWWKSKNERIIGLDRIYDFTVTVSGAETATFSYCEDSTKLEYRNVTTGRQIANDASTANNHTLREGQLAKGTGELWAVYSLLTQDGAAQCMGN
jgi:hypothetical protein